jgi:hypothetical protein
MGKKADGKERLPRELQEYKKKLKELDFKDRVKAYFDCSPFQRDIDALKKRVIYNSFTRKEKEEFSNKYAPIYSAIDKYGDRVRAIHGNWFIYSFYIDTTLRQKDAFSYTADLLNRARSFTAEALEGMEEGDTKKKVEKIDKSLSSYNYSNMISPKIIEEEGGQFGVNFSEIDKDLLKIIETLKGLLSLLKCYLESLREFLEWVGTPELFPREFAEMERGFKHRYYPVEIRKRKEDSEHPLFNTVTEAEKVYLSINYEELPRTVDIFGENNLWADHYKSLFNY